MTIATAYEYFEIRPCVEFDDETCSYLGEPQFWENGGMICKPEVALQAAIKDSNKNDGGDVFWTVYGYRGGCADAIADLRTFNDALELVNRLLAPLAAARNLLALEDRDEYGDLTDECQKRMQMADCLDDIINQSSTEQRL